MPESEIKMRKCRACGKDVEIGKECGACGWDEDEEVSEVKRRRLQTQIEKELEAEDLKSKKKEKTGGIRLPFSRR